MVIFPGGLLPPHAIAGQWGRRYRPLSPVAHLRGLFAADRPDPPLRYLRHYPAAGALGRRGLARVAPSPVPVPEGFRARIDPGLRIERRPGAEGGAADQVGADRRRGDHEEEDEERLDHLDPGLRLTIAARQISARPSVPALVAACIRKRRR